MKCKTEKKINKKTKSTRVTIRKLINTNRNTDENIPSVFTEGITVGKKIKTKQKNDNVSFLPTELPMEFILLVKSFGKSVGKLWILFIMSIIKGITDGIFHRYFPESSRTVHFPVALLIVVLYGQNHDELKSHRCYLAVFWKNSISLKFSFKYYRRNHRRIEKPSVIVGSF